MRASISFTASGRLFVGLVLLTAPQAVPQETASGPFLNIHKYIHGNKLANLPDSGEHFKSSDQSAPADLAKGECRDQPDFGTKICKDASASDFPPSTVIRPTYSRWATDNSDGSLYYVVKNVETPPKSGRGQMVILRSSDNSVYSIPNLNSLEGAEFRWDSSGKFPTRMYYRAGCAFHQYDVASGKNIVIRDFASWVQKTFGEACGKIFNDVEGDSSPDSRYWAFMITKPYQYGTFPLLAVIVYDKDNDEITGVLDRHKYLDQGGSDRAWESYGYRPNMVDIAPSGDRVLLLWGCAQYPVEDGNPVFGKSKLSAGLITLTSLAPTDNYTAGARIILNTTDPAASALNGSWTIASVPDRHTLAVNVGSSGLRDGSYSVRRYRPAIVSVVAKKGVVTVTTSLAHQLSVNVNISLAGVPNPPLNGKFRVTGVVSPTIFTINAAVDDAEYTADGMYMQDSRSGACIPDGDLQFPAAKSSIAAASDGPHVYNLDFSNPVKVCNHETHGGWAWLPDGTPAYVCQINSTNWSRAEADTFGFTNIYTGVYTPILAHADLFYQGGVHFGRFYNREIRGWAMMTVQQDLGDTNKLRDTLTFLELKHYRDQPRIWRAGQMLNNHFGYDSEGHGPLSRDGLTFRFGGNWNGATKAAPINTYSIRLPANWWKLVGSEGAIRR